MSIDTIEHRIAAEWELAASRLPPLITPDDAWAVSELV